MRLEAYLKVREESQSAFARRAGISQQVVANICGGAGCHSTTVKAVREATGGMVDVNDLQPSGAPAAETGS